MNKLEELLVNEDFKDWVLKPNKQRDDYWQMYLEKDAEAKKVYQKAAYVIRQVSFRDVSMTAGEKDRVFEEIAKDKPKKKRFWKNWKWMKIAAILFLLTSSFFIYQWKYLANTFI